MKENAYLEFLRMLVIDQCDWPKRWAIGRKGSFKKKNIVKILNEDERYARWEAERQKNAIKGSFTIEDFR